MKNDPQTARLNIAKHIDQYNAAAWGTPVFIFKIKQSAYYNTGGQLVPIAADEQPVLTKTASPTTVAMDGFEDETGWFEVEPGAYEITEVRVARYTADGDSVFEEAVKLSDTANTAYTAALTIEPDGSAKVKFNNRLTNFEKLNHTDQKNNRFNGYKAIRLIDQNDLRLTNDEGNHLYSVTIPKSAFAPKLIKSDTTQTAITDYDRLAITCEDSDNEITVTDNGTSITVKGRKEDVSSSIYTLKAVYNNTFTTEFELRFAADPLFSKTEKTVIFKTDAANMSYYQDGTQKNGVYSLIFILENEGASHTVKKILHNGTPLSATDATVFPDLIIDDLFKDRYAFDKWQAEYGNTTASVTGAQALFDLIRNAPDDAETITVTPVLKQK